MNSEQTSVQKVYTFSNPEDLLKVLLMGSDESQDGLTDYLVFKVNRDFGSRKKRQVSSIDGYFNKGEIHSGILAIGYAGYLLSKDGHNVKITISPSGSYHLCCVKGNEKDTPGTITIEERELESLISLNQVHKRDNLISTPIGNGARNNARFHGGVFRN